MWAPSRARNVICVTVLFYLVIALIPLAMAPTCGSSEAGSRAVAAQAGDGADDGDGESGTNPGVFILVIVVASIVVAMIMLLRRLGPGLPRDDGSDGR